ncbi:hypothetical protein ACU4GI_03135 [Cupriavidus basilensis]
MTSNGQAPLTHEQLIELYGPKVLPGYHVVEYQYADGSGSWCQCEPQDLTDTVLYHLQRNCAVWVDGIKEI